MRLDGETRVERHIGELDRLRRLYKTLHRVNQSFVRSHTREELFDEVCRAAVEQGGFLKSTARMGLPQLRN
jgi:hypothetical protein